MDNATDTIRKALSDVRVGPPLSDRTGRLPHVTVYPLLPASIPGTPPGIATLSDGRDGGALIEEVSCEDAVRISNPLPVSLYAGESECLVGRTQNRALKHDALIPPRTSRYALVNCVEQGQPTRHGKGFSADAVCPWGIRLDKMRQLARDGRIDQNRVWDQVDGFLRRARVHSLTRDLHAALDERKQVIAGSLRSFPPLPAQVGVLTSVGSNLFLDLFSEPEILERRLGGVLTSALMEGLVGFTDVRVPPEAARRALTDLLSGGFGRRNMRPCFSSSQDRSTVLWRPDATASAFFSDGRLHHLAAHLTPGELVSGGPDHSRRLDDIRTGFLADNREWLDTLRAAYAPRHRSYAETIAGLSARSEAWRTRARVLRQTAGPPPGHLLGVEEAAHVGGDAFEAPGVEAVVSAVSGYVARVTEAFSADMGEAERSLDRLRVF